MKVFFDNNASTRVDARVLDAMSPFFTDIISPPSSEYGNSFGIEAQEAMDESRKVIAKKLNVNPTELVFTSGQAESNNSIIKGFALANHTRVGSKLILASTVSHSTVIESIKSLVKNMGFEFLPINVDSEGFVRLDHLKELLEKNPLLVSIPHGNVEIGTVENIAEIAKLCQDHQVPMHVDMTYSFCKVPTDASVVDMATISGHLIHGPKGIGAFYLRKGLKILPLLDGGLQENRKRAGTENLPGIVGFAEAVKQFNDKVIEKIEDLRNYTHELFRQNITDYQITGPKDMSKRLPGHFSAVISYVEGESILLYLDMLNFMVATGSACSSKQLKASHVLSAIGLPTEISHGSIRLGFSKYTQKEQLDEFIIHLKNTVSRLREMSPMDAEFIREWETMKKDGEVTEDDHHTHELEDD
ncbi:MAG: cysteine desulfurase [Candidatus Heimdallarchaeota archaeon]|nr:cysteine desulfurase [Candidatus Heimdallarchaeota archaeon]